MLSADPIERQVRQVRRRRNLHELQRALFLLIAVAAAGAAVLVVLALAASERLFAVAGWSVSGAITVTVLLVARELGRRWMAPGAAAPWIDERARLRGTLATLVATRARGASDRDRFFLPLLAARNLEQLQAWRPERLVRRRVPLGALASALSATTALVLAIMLAPGLRPHIPEIVYSDEPVDGAARGDPEAGVPDRMIVAPTRDQARKDDSGDDGTGAGAGSDDGDERSALERFPSEVQDRIRRRLWGREWEQARDAMARNERARKDAAASARAGGEPAGDSGSGDDEGGDDWETAGLPAARRGRRGAASAFARARDGAEASDAEAAARGFGDEQDAAETGAGASEVARGAGNETDPNLFGSPSDTDTTGNDTFELAITAPVRSQRAGPRRASGDPPPPSDDAHPELARNGRQERALRKMAVPAAYEAIVREVFAHRDAEAERRP